MNVVDAKLFRVNMRTGIGREGTYLGSRMAGQFRDIEKITASISAAISNIEIF